MVAYSTLFEINTRKGKSISYFSIETTVTHAELYKLMTIQLTTIAKPVVKTLPCLIMQSPVFNMHLTLPQWPHIGNLSKHNHVYIIRW